MEKFGIPYLEELINARWQVEYEEEWSSWRDKIPDLHFDSDWNVRIIPPFGGALIRFVVSKNNKFVSVYFDGYSRLGYMYENDDPIPYFEIYPAPDSDDVRRYFMDETEEMILDIRTVLNS